MSTRLTLALYKVRHRDPHTGEAKITHALRLIDSTPTSEPVDLKFRPEPFRGGAGGIERTKDQIVAGRTVSLSDHAHAVAWVLAHTVVDLSTSKSSDFDGELDAWNVEAKSRAQFKTAIWHLMPRKVFPDSEITLPPVDWSKLARPVSDVDEQRAPGAERRAPWFKRWLGLGER